MAALNSEQVRALENIRTRLLTLRSSLGKLQENLVTSQPLPSASALQTSSNVVSSSLQTLAEQLSEHQYLLSSTAVFPLPQFPGRYQGHILTDTLLRTKLEPNVEEWVEQGQRLAKEQQQQQINARGLSETDRNRLWRWAPGAANREARKQKWGADYTLAEVRSGVNTIATGLRRDLVEPEDDDEEYNEDDEDEYEEEVTDDEHEANPDKMEIEPSATIAGAEGVATTSLAANGAQAGDGVTQPAMAGKPAYLETLHEYMTVGKVQKYSPKAIEDRAEAERKNQRVAPVN